MADYNKTITVPEVNIPELVEVFGQNHDPKDGMSKVQYANDILALEMKQYIKRRVVDYRKQQARKLVNEDFDIT